MDNPEVYNVVGSTSKSGIENYYIYKRQGEEEFTLNVVILGDQAYVMCSDKSKSTTVDPFTARYAVLVQAAKAVGLSTKVVHEAAAGIQK